MATSAVKFSPPKLAQLKPGKLLIGGKWVDAKSGKRFDALNPATGQTLTTLAEGDKADVDLAVKAARAAFEGAWAKLLPRERQAMLWKVGDLILENADEIAEIESLDNGKPIRESRNVDIPMAAEVFRYYAGWVTKIHGETVPVNGPFFNYTLREPMGVVGQIIPWNFPLLMAAWKLAPALACGNTCVLKPAEQTSLSALRLGELILEAGLPEGVVNIITGFGPTAGAALSAHMDVDKIAFTGETSTGRLILEASAKSNLKRPSLELGGKSPNIVFADADMDTAVRGTFTGIFFNQGQVCCAGSRLFVEEKAHDVFMEKLVARAAKIKQGDPLDPGTTMGPQVSKEQMEKVLSYLELGRQEGAQPVLGGGPSKLAEETGGYFVEPTIFDRATNDMRLAREEIFGPVLTTITFRDIEDVVRQGNDTLYGLAAGVFTSDVRKAHRVAAALRAGTVWVNTWNVFDPASPFGGYKMSGFGRELGAHCLELYTQTKSVWVNLG
ncbi:MAG: aldehyde dehydrogenase family protein [Deltaproteobacteria bacterium]|nr:aldehyde dehydrogenase family protein [Deltaproteobacteria bacterium]